jgi:hypothetical protein
MSGNPMCTCAMHCPRSPYHEKACCNQDCNCWCHERERAKLITEIESIWPRVNPHLPLRTELMARFGKSSLSDLADNQLRRIRLEIAM